MNKNVLREKIKTAEEMKELMENPRAKKFFQEANRMIERQTTALTNLLSKDLEMDARLGQVIRAEIRGMKAVAFLPQNLIKQGEEALKKLQKEEK